VKVVLANPFQALSILRLLDATRHVSYPSGEILVTTVENLLKSPGKRLRRCAAPDQFIFSRSRMTLAEPAAHRWKKQSAKTLALHKGLRGDQARPLHRSAANWSVIDDPKKKPPGPATRISYLAGRNSGS